MTEEEQEQFEDRLDDIVEDIIYDRSDAWVDWEWPDGESRPYLQVHARRPDTYTGEMGVGAGGKYWVSAHATKSEIVQAIFGLFKAYEEHEAREAFMYKGVRVFGPHIDVDVLVDVASNLDVRTPRDDPA